jgi:ProQ/FINO family
LVGGDVGDGVGCHGARVELHRVHWRAVDVGCDAEVEVCCRAGDGGAEVGVGATDLDDGGELVASFPPFPSRNKGCGMGAAPGRSLGNGAARVYGVRNEEWRMSSTYRSERDRGSKESWQHLAVLREKWPLAFPVEHQDVRPLAMGVARQIAAAMGWSLPNTLGVLGGWKMAPVYCQAVLRYDQRIALDGTPAETVDAGAKDLAIKQLARLAARKATAPAVVKPKSAPASPTETPPTPEQLRDRVRASLLRRSA